MYSDPDAARKIFMQKIMEAQGGGSPGTSISGLGTPGVPESQPITPVQKSSGPWDVVYGPPTDDTDFYGRGPEERREQNTKHGLPPDWMGTSFSDGPNAPWRLEQENSPDQSYQSEFPPADPVGIAPDSWQQAGFTPQGDRNDPATKTAIEKLLARLAEMNQ